MEDTVGDGAVILNGTDGSSTDAGDRIRFELATDDNINNNYPLISSQSTDIGGFDVSRSIRFSSSVKTFDANVTVVA